MKLLEGLTLRPLGPDYIVTGESLDRVDFSKVVSLNETAAWLWERLRGRDFSTEDAAALLCANYEVSEQTARADAEHLIAAWRKAGLLEPDSL